MTLSTLVDLLNRQSAELPTRPALRFLESGDVTGPIATWTYHDLASRARAVASQLHAEGVAPGERVLLLYPSGVDFIGAFFGCMIAGVVAVPVWPPEPPRMARGVAAIEAIARDCAPTAVLTTHTFTTLAGAMSEQLPGLAALRLLATDGAAPATSEAATRSTAQSLALLQYTSGSTGTPKGVRMTHGNLLANQRMIQSAMRLGSGSEAVGWLPLYHDMGLIGNVVQTVYNGGCLSFLSPLHFLERPLRWLEAISHFRAYVSGGPNFGYALCTRKAAGADLSMLDLSSWRTAFVGAEPVRADTMNAFAEAFAARGFDRSAIFPTYGLAEATLFVTGAHADHGLHAASPSAGGPPCIGCGTAAKEVEVAVVDAERRVRQGEAIEGEVWIRGPTVAEGYWGEPEPDQRAFGQSLENTDGWLRTGDLGFFSGGQLCITGRLKDLIIVRGRNIYPQDLERAAEQASQAVRTGCAAAFAVPGDDGSEAVGLAVELRAEIDDAALPGLAEAITAAVSAAAGASVARLALLHPRALPKTSSGKVRRQTTRQALERGELVPRYLYLRPGAPRGRVEADPQTLHKALREAVAARLQHDPADISLDRSLDELGLDSVARMELLAQVRELLGVDVPAAIMAEAPTLRAFARALEGAAHQAPAPTRAEPATTPSTLLPDPSWMGEF